MSINISKLMQIWTCVILKIKFLMCFTFWCFLLDLTYIKLCLRLYYLLPKKKKKVAD